MYRAAKIMLFSIYATGVIAGILLVLGVLGLFEVF